MSETIESLTKKLNEIRETMKRDAAELMGGHLKNVLAALPAEVSAIRWSQYTPYFNDGEPCEFGVNEAQFKITNPPGDGFYLYDSDDDGAFYDVGYRATGPLAAACGATQTALREVPREFYEAAFGDHARVTVTRNGDGVTVEVDGYDHD